MIDFELERFGILEGISEVIATSVSKEGILNAAPIGIHRWQDNVFALIYRGGKTYENVVETKMLTANIIHDPVLFVQSALGDLGSEYFSTGKPLELENRSILDVAYIPPPLNGALAWVLFGCECHPGSNLMKVDLKPLTGDINENLLRIRPVNRGFNAVIEALIYATRYVLSRNPEYMDRVNYYNNIAIKCGDGRTLEAMKLLYRMMDAPIDFEKSLNSSIA